MARAGTDDRAVHCSGGSLGMLLLSSSGVLVPDKGFHPESCTEGISAEKPAHVLHLHAACPAASALRSNGSPAACTCSACQGLLPRQGAHCKICRGFGCHCDVCPVRHSCACPSSQLTLRQHAGCR